MRPLLVLLAAALVACTGAEAAPAPVAAPVTTPHPAVVLIERLSASEGSAMPDLVGMDAEPARTALRAEGMVAQLVAFDASITVSAQYPPAGTPRPADGAVMLWFGEPPVPPPPAPAAPDPEPAPAAAFAAVAEPTPTPAPEVAGPAASPPAVEPSPTAEPAPPPAAPSGPPPKRSNIRTMPPAEPGTVLSGPASWYGPGFEGRTTACGGTFDPAQLTLASRELRCGTVVEITGPSGASVTATVTDWGPAEWTNRRFDLSQAAFAAIHHLGAGVIPVTITVLD